MNDRSAVDLIPMLREAMGARVLSPGDGQYRDLLQGFNLAVQHHPDVVVAAGSTMDVQRTVESAARTGARVDVIGGGHGAAGGIRGGIALLMSELGGVTVDRAARTARLAAGARWADVLDATTPLGLAPLAGSSPRVGAVGYTLGGGLGPVARTFGFAADHVRSLEVVDGRGGFMEVTASTDRELFWALRGGKTGLGVVTAMTIDLFEIQELYGGGLYFRADDAATVLHGWLDWTAGLPESVTTSAALLRLPPDPALPEPLRGQTVLHVRIAHVGDSAEGETLVKPLRSLADPVLDVLGPMPYADLAAIHSDPVDPMPYTDAGTLLGSLDHDAVDRLLAVVGAQLDVPLAVVELRHLGGAISRQPSVPNAVAGRDAAFSLFLIGAPVPELLDTVVPEAIRRAMDAVTPWRTGSQPNFLGSTNTDTEIDGCWSADVARRLDSVRWRVDPLGVLGGPARDR